MNVSLKALFTRVDAYVQSKDLVDLICACVVAKAAVYLMDAHPVWAALCWITGILIVVRSEKRN
jgi:hypothetical protein